MSRAMFVVLLLMAAAPGTAGGDLPAPMSIAELRAAGIDAGIKLERVRDLEPGPGYTAYLIAYEHSGLRLYAMVAVPESPMPRAGYPIVYANHGYVPDPRKYGITKDGSDSRPGDYYRSVPGLFASRGFLTVMPDYRGHNDSEGFNFIDPQDERSAGYYAEDVMALMSAPSKLAEGDERNLFVWSHSMGGAVSMRVLLAHQNVRASSFWSTMNVDEHLGDLAELDGPVNVHHAVGDEATPHSNSESLAAALERAGLLGEFNSVPGDDHYFTGEAREAAAQRDAELFRSHVRREP